MGEKLIHKPCEACKNVKRLSNVIEIFKSFRLPHSGKSFFQQHIYGYELDVKTLSSNIGIIGSQSFDVQNYMPSHFYLLAITSKAINIKLFIILFILLAKPNRNSGHLSLKV